jgi:hydroxymethylpyrimidine pyrophosphatase-like HAD family hydrolase
MNLPIKLISTDFDGTLFEERGEPPISERALALLREFQERGAKWVINTGRDLAGLTAALAQAGVGIQPDYLVLVEREIHVNDGAGFVGLAEWNTACSRDHAELFARVRPDVPRLMGWVNARYRAKVYEDAYSPFCLIADTNNEADAIHEFLTDYCRRVPQLAVVRNDVYARFSHAAYNKGTALAELTRRLSLFPEQVFAAGDHYNDLPMLARERAGWLAAPGNAVEAVKQTVRRQGGFVSERSHGEGVADALEFLMERTGVENEGLSLPVSK